MARVEREFGAAPWAEELWEDVLGARRMGIRAIWMTARPLPDVEVAERPDAIIASLMELPRVAESWLAR